MKSAFQFKAFQATAFQTAYTSRGDEVGRIIVQPQNRVAVVYK